MVKQSGAGERTSCMHSGWTQNYVHLVSSAFAATNTAVVKWWQKDGSIKEIDCPRLVAEYTASMGCVNQFDQRRGYYSVNRRPKRCCLRNLFFLFDTAVVNAHAPHSSVHHTGVLNQLNFPVKLLRGLLGTLLSRKRQEDCERCCLSSDSCHYKQCSWTGSCKTALLPQFVTWTFQCLVEANIQQHMRYWWQAADLQSDHSIVRMSKQSSQRVECAMVHVSADDWHIWNNQRLCWLWAT